jgi:alkaline phosphatase D
VKIAFASCTKIQNQPVQPVWRRILDKQPDHLLLLGDNVYAPGVSGSLKKLEKRYRQQFVEANFRELIDRVPFNAIWDDHDFAWNDAKGAHISSTKYKEKSRALFHEFMNCSTNRPHVYHAFEKGDVKFIMLDVRYYREKNHIRRNATVLGDEQAAWLEAELKHKKRYTVVCSGSCLTEGTEKLEHYDEFYPHLCALLKKSPRTLFLCGDVHENAFKAHDGFYEVISSGAGRDNLNNYGLIDFGTDNVTITLIGEKRQRDNLTRTIRSKDWSVIAN